MALTLPRWAAIVAAAAMVALAFFSRSPSDPEYPEDARQQLLDREREMNYAASRAADRLRVAILVDSVRASLRASRTDSMRILFGRGVPAPEHPIFRNAVAMARRDVGAPLPIDVVFVSDSGNLVRGVNRGANPWIRPDYVLPAASGDRCIVLVRLSTSETGDARHLTRLASAISERRLLGPCAFVGAFGQPGRKVAEWLRAGAWGFAGANEWTRAARPWEPPRYYASDPQESLRWFIGLDGLRCAAGARDACADVAVHPRADGRVARYPDIWGDRIVSVGSANNELWYRLSLGPQSASLLSDLVHEVGAERFRRFWTSDEPVPDAFRDATGRELADFTRDWMTRQYGRARRGPAAPASSVPSGLALVGLGVVAAVFVVRRRQVA